LNETVPVPNKTDAIPVETTTCLN